MTTPASPAWLQLQEHYHQLSSVHMRDLFRDDPDRFSRFSLDTGPLFLDYSKNRITRDTLSCFLDLAKEARLAEAIAGMFRGDKINLTEQRAVLHTALRNHSSRPVLVDGEDVMPKIKAVLGRMRVFCEALHAGRWRGYSDEPIRAIVNIGIGGSHLGPQMVTRALRPYRKPSLTVHFVSNVDANDIIETLDRVNPETTLFVIASKTFTTQETMVNANTARDWFLSKAGDPDAIARHFVAVSTNVDAARAFGIEERNVFEFWDWVGGRYSSWSAIGLPIALYIGMDNFDRLLSGAYQMDEHFRTAVFERNAPVIMALLGVWYNNLFGAQTRAVIPYDQTLEYLPAYLQQLEMESNGKSVDRQGKPIAYDTGPVVWGAPGTNGQHAFFQLIHQGTKLMPVDFLAPLHSHSPIGDHHALLLANCFAQSEALMRGKTEAEVEEEMRTQNFSDWQRKNLITHRSFAGNKPSNTILFEQLTPEVLGSLIALYEHKTFTEGVLWNINSFDQWGVELGKQLANRIVKDFTGDSISDHDSSTRGLIERYKANR